MPHPPSPARTVWRIPSAGIAALVALAGGWLLAAPPALGPAGVVPGPGDHTLLSWREGPPYFTTARYSPERRFLRLETGHFAAEFDTERVAVTGFACTTPARPAVAATRAALEAEPLPPAQLQLVLHVGGIAYLCQGRRALAFDSHGLPAAPLDFPVRVIESGRFFQKFTLHDLEFHDPTGRRLPVAARLEIAAWPDRLALTLVVRPAQPLAAAHAFLRLQSAGGMDASLAETPATWEPAADHRATLTLAATGSALAPAAPAGLAVHVNPTDPRDRAAVTWDPEEMCHRVRLETAPWPLPAEGVYPEAMLEAWETHAVTLANDTATPQPVALCFAYTPIKSITAYVPMLLDAEGNPTGLPMQISKNWHVMPAAGALPHAGQWMHARTRLRLPPNSRLTLLLGTTFAHWGGLPAASLAQLSLVGWGHNGFWDQFALGGFGETFCFQPGRTMRRALFTDFRPLYQRGFAQDERWAWPSNVGGGDTMVRYDAQDRYVPFKRNVTRHVSPGPNLAQLEFQELAADAAVRSRVEVWLPRTDDCARVYVRVHYEVLRRAAFSRLALFQLGADYYSDADSTLIAWGDAGGLRAENHPKPHAGARLLPLWEARGDQPWISLHGQARADLERNGQSSRGLIVREWRAVLGGRTVPAPFFAAVGSRGTKSRLAAEIVPPPGLTALEPGDRVDLLVELVALPLAAERYYGPNAAFATALTAAANTWRMVHREAADNRPQVQLPAGTTVKSWPLTVPAGREREAVFSLHGGLGWIPVRLSGLTRPDAVELYSVTPAGRERVEQGPPGRAYWQTDYDEATDRWRVTYNLPAAAQPVTYVALVPTAEAPPPAAPVRTAIPVAP